MSAKVRLDALGDKTFNGKVTRVNEYPEPSSWFSSQVKEYATFVQITDSPERIRPGLTAEVTILVNRMAEAITVPVQSIVERDRGYYCLVQDGTKWQARPVSIAASNEKFVAVSEGVDVGDVVAMNPRELTPQVSFPPPVNPPAESAVAMVAQTDPPAPRQPSRSNDPPQQGADAAAIVDRIFQRMDANQDGKIAKDELPAEQASRLSAADSNGDGAIDRAELQQSIQQRAQSMGGN
jgi:hypothetical protein